ncbi:MAG: hypothetical protein NXI20_24355, partial [bacterium]|nr:hypothetical protein [bacterium]
NTMKIIFLFLTLLLAHMSFGQFKVNVQKPEQYKKLEQYKSYLKLFKSVKKDSIKSIDQDILNEQEYLDSLNLHQPNLDSSEYFAVINRIDSLENFKASINWDSLKMVYKENLKIHFTRRVSDQYNRLAEKKFELPDGKTDSDVVNQMLQPPGALKLDSASFTHPNKVLSQQAQQLISQELKDNQKINQINKKIARYKKKFSRVNSLSNLKSGTKKSSLKGVPFFKKFVYGGNIDLDVNLKTKVDFAPYVGYMFTKKYLVGVSGMYRFYLNYQPNYFERDPQRTLAINAFTRYSLSQKLFFQSELEYRRKREIEEMIYDTGWFIGAGKSVYQKNDKMLSVLVLYNILYQKNAAEKVYNTPWSIRVNLQFSPMKKLRGS